MPIIASCSQHKLHSFPSQGCSTFVIASAPASAVSGASAAAAATAPIDATDAVMLKLNHVAACYRYCLSIV